MYSLYARADFTIKTAGAGYKITCNTKVKILTGGYTGRQNQRKVDIMKNEKIVNEVKTAIEPEAAYRRFIAELARPAVSAAVKAAAAALAGATDNLRTVAASGDVEKIMTASAAVQAATKALEKVKAANKPRALTMPEVAARLVCCEGFTFKGYRGEVETFARVCVRVMRDATGEEMALAATRTVSQALIAAVRNGYIQVPEPSPVMVYLREQVNFPIQAEQGAEAGAEARAESGKEDGKEEAAPEAGK